MHKVLLTDSMQEVLDDLAFALGDHFEVKTCSNGLWLQDMVREFKPDILLLDLSMPGYDPTAFLYSLSEIKPKIIATAYYTNDHLVSVLEEYQVSHLMIKPLNADGVAATLLKLEQGPQLRCAVYEAVASVGVKLRYGGFDQLTEGILFACENEHYSVTDELYPHVARVLGSTEQAVEKAISRCIRHTYNCADRALWQQLFGQRDCPSNGVFIRRMTLAVMARRKKPNH